MPHVSATRLPSRDRDGVLGKIRARGVKTRVDPACSQMLYAELPPGWYVLQVGDRGDLKDGYLVDDKHVVVAEWDWVSKGSYDNQADIYNAGRIGQVINPDNIEHVATLGVWVPKKREGVADAHAANAFVARREGGAVQAELDKCFEALPPGAKKLIDDRGYPREALPRDEVTRSAVSSLVIARRIVFPAPTVSIWAASSGGAA